MSEIQVLIGLVHGFHTTVCFLFFFFFFYGVVCFILIMVLESVFGFLMCVCFGSLVCDQEMFDSLTFC